MIAEYSGLDGLSLPVQCWEPRLVQPTSTCGAVGDYHWDLTCS